MRSRVRFSPTFPMARGTIWPSSTTAPPRPCMSTAYAKWPIRASERLPPTTARFSFSATMPLMGKPRSKALSTRFVFGPQRPTEPGLPPNTPPWSPAFRPSAPLKPLTTIFPSSYLRPIFFRITIPSVFLGRSAMRERRRRLSRRKSEPKAASIRRRKRLQAALRTDFPTLRLWTACVAIRPTMYGSPPRIFLEPVRRPRLHSRR